MLTFSIKEKEDDFSEEDAKVSGATAFLLRGTEGSATPLWEGAGRRSGATAKDIALGLPTTVVAGVGVRWMEALVLEQIETWEEAWGTNFLPLPFADPNSLTMVGVGGISSSAGSSSSSITSRAE